MADPISLAGTAVGVTSLGIQVCKELVSYIDSVANRNKDLRDTANQIDLLNKEFKVLEAIVPRIRALSNHNPSALTALDDCIKQCKIKVNELYIFLQSLQAPTSSSGSNVRGRIVHIKNTLVYPFREDQLRTLRAAVFSLVELVRTAIHTIDLDLGVSQRLDLLELKSNIDHNHAANVQAIGTLAQDVQDTKAGLQQLNNHSSVMTSRLEDVGKDAHTSAQILPAVLKHLHESNVTERRNVTASHNQHAEVMARFNDMEENINKVLARCLLPKPDALRQACDEAGLNSDHPGWNMTSRQRNWHMNSTATPSICRCTLLRNRTRTSETSISMSVLMLYQRHRESSWHYKKCPLHNLKSDSSKSVGIKFPVVISRKLSVLIDLNLGFSYGAGGNSINAPLSYHVWVQDTPASALLTSTAIALYSNPPASRARIVDKATQQILALFRHGEASPYEKTGPNQSTYLHLACDHLLPSILDLALEDRTEMSLLYASVFGLLETLISCGVPRRETNAAQQDVAMDIILKTVARYPTHPTSHSSIEWNALLDKLFELTDDGTDYDLREYRKQSDWPVDTKRSIINICRFYPAIWRVTGASPLFSAILQQSVADLRASICQYPEELHETWFGMTVLHLSSWWPTGLSLLLEAGTSDLLSRTYGDQLPIDIAIESDCLDAVRLLFEYGAVWNGIPWTVQRSVSSSCVQLLAQTLMLRRRQLSELARKKISTIGNNRATHDVDLKAPSLLRALREANVDVPTELECPYDYEGIYHCGNLPLSWIPIFYEAGFHNINSHRQDGRTPLMHSRNEWLGLENLSRPIGGETKLDNETPLVIQWLHDHHCLDQIPLDPLNLGFNTSASCHHILTAGLVDNRLYCHEFVSLFSTVWQYLKIGAHDSCRCWCSPRGCLPISHLLRSVAESMHNSYLHDQKGGDIFLYRPMTEFHEEAIRFLTFEALEMTHTCCFARALYAKECHARPRMLMSFQGDTQAIQHEEKELGDRLELLLVEFKRAYLLKAEGECSDCFPDGPHRIRGFIHGYWRRRMGEECVHDETELENLVAIGVRPQTRYQTPIRLRRVLGRGFRLQDGEEACDDDDELYATWPGYSEYSSDGEDESDDEHNDEDSAAEGRSSTRRIERKICDGLCTIRFSTENASSVEYDSEGSEDWGTGDEGERYDDDDQGDDEEGEAGRI